MGRSPRARGHFALRARRRGPIPSARPRSIVAAERTSMIGLRHLAACAALAAWAAPSLARAAGDPSTAGDVVSKAEGEGKVVVYSTTDSASFQPMLKDFAALHPKIQVEYDDMNSTEVYNRYVSEAAAGSNSADLLWSSAMDLQVKLASDGYAQEYASPEASKLPQGFSFKNQAYGTTYEPICFVYNKRLLKPDEIPQSHAELVKLLRTRPDRFKGKLTSYDPERSGLGFLLITQDARVEQNFQEAEKAYGSVAVKLYTSTGAMLERISSGEHLLGFNMIGSYGVLKAKKDQAIGIVLPKDYTLIMSRVALIAKDAKHPNAARVFLDYLLSQRGQQALAKASVYAIRSDVEGETTQAAVAKALGQAVKPIPVDASLLSYLDQTKRLEFLRQWQQAMSGK
jgi:iron(III) transport system substrate-binding protein